VAAAHVIPVLRHVPHEPLGILQQSLAEAHLAFRYVDLFEEVPETLPLADAPGLIVLGGPMNVDQTERYPFLADEVAWIREAIARGMPVLGICLGGQLIAKALGASVCPNGVQEIGWYPIRLLAAADEDRLFGSVPTSRPTVFQWHGDMFAIPPEAVPLAEGELCRNQAFRHGDRVYALQFHLEMTAAMIDRWLDEPTNAAELAEIDPAEIRRRTPEQLPPMQALGRVVFGRFAALCAAEVG